MTAAALIRHTKQLAAACQPLTFAAPVTHVYHPLIYARRPHFEYIKKYGNSRKKNLFIGINPGPWGMAQTGIPFGDVASVRDWLGIQAKVDTPKNTHPKRPVLGFSCPRAEISGQRLWQLFKQRYGTPQHFFADNFVMNYCPLLFLSAHPRGIKNLTPDTLPAATTAELYAHCTTFLHTACDILQPDTVIGIGQFVQKQLHQLIPPTRNIRIASVLHPSPASPAANRSFLTTAHHQLDKLKI